MVVLDVIERKRDGLRLDAECGRVLVRGLETRRMMPYQLAAFNVAAAIRGLSDDESEMLSAALKAAGLSSDSLELSDVGIDRPLYGGHLAPASRPVHAIIRNKIAGEALTDAEIADFVRGVSDNSVRDEDIAAFCMAVFIRGMTPAEILALTQSMLHSGEVLEWHDLPGPTVDKHSTGGVGDKVSLPLAGVLAACGACVPMISGRGLGHTGGTLDKLQSIPGYRIDLSPEEIREHLRTVRAVITGQTSSLAPADRRLYAIRDVTGTVSSIPLITASILSKKLAEGLVSLVLDVKVGSGAFMETFEDAEKLADSLGKVGRAAGVQVSALLTPMHEPLGIAVGNANEVQESIDCLKGKGPADLEVLVVKLGAELLASTGLTPDLEAGEKAIREAITSGRGLEFFRKMVEAQGGDPGVFDDPGRLPSARLRETITASSDGYVSKLDARQIGRALIALGGGRRVQEDIVDPGVGITVLRKVGSRVRPGDPIIELNANEPERLSEARDMVEAALEITPEAPPAVPLILGRK